MYAWDEFKWSVKEPTELIPALRCISKLPDAQYREGQRKGQAYAAEYLRPVTESGLRVFWEA